MKVRIALTASMVLLALGLHLWSLASVGKALKSVAVELEEVRSAPADTSPLNEEQKSALIGAEVRLMKIHSNQMAALLPIHMFFVVVIACIPFVRTGKRVAESQEPRHE